MTHGNVTISPHVFATPVLRPAIEEVLDLDDGEYHYVKKLIGGRLYPDLIVLRGQVRERMETERPKYACSMCSVPVYIVATSEKRFFFRHRIEDGSCPALTRSVLTPEQILARKYQGQKESEAHHRIKGFIERSLTADADFTEIAVERTWRSSDDPKRYRRPDVQADFRGQKIAIEVQLSTTFLSVVVGRRAFYREQGALLAWVFGHFDESYRRLTTDDLLFWNNSNVFVVDEETARKSVELGQFVLKCHHRKPLRQGDRVADEWPVVIVPFAELTIDLVQQRLFLFDYDTENRAVHAAIAQDAIDREAKRDRRLRERFGEFWCGERDDTPWKELEEQWLDLHGAFAERGISVPRHLGEDPELRSLLNAIFSVKEGRSIGWDFRKLVEIGHHLAAAHPRLLLAFGFAVREFDRTGQMESEDVTGKWARKREGVAARLRGYDPALAPDETHLELLNFLFPELKEPIAGYLRRAAKHRRQ